jgi:hypothetical protein
LAHFGKSRPNSEEVTYKPVIAVFATAALMALSFNWAAFGTLLTIQAVEWFIAISMCVLAILKLRDIESFSNMFLGYDLLAQRYVPYAYVHPFGEALAGILMVAGALLWVAIPVALVIGTIGVISVGANITIVMIFSTSHWLCVCETTSKRSRTLQSRQIRPCILIGRGHL